ncbi:hypothetical protein [Arsenicibacter rosenii]|uniref:Uncharacterized protein n=1 Tax=Arsenicibacter rosenii TaxID=1750698 RepID=A0A1S2VLT8_9BACT|nr:hypothetical protein [Arsenicibacter rosenii]OIN59709.1 hypothetical protein BLX24_07530 [Arsenicibacter rosenii]
MFLQTIFTQLKTVKFYAIGAGLLLGLFIWADFTGTRLIGDDKETVEDHGQAGSHHYAGRSRHYYGGRSSFHHK